MSNTGSPHGVLLEVCVDSPASARAAQEGGAGRVELCADLMSGGITPAAGMIEVVREALHIPLHVMIRPRGGDFRYDGDEYEVMRRDILIAKTLGADGVVFGGLTSDRMVDVAGMRRLIDAARPMSVTFHRAFDEIADPVRACDDLIGIGIDRLLTSGHAPGVEEGMDLLSRLVRRTSDRLMIIAGGGVTHANVMKLIRSTGVREVHVLRAVTEKVDSGNGQGSLQNPPVVSTQKVIEMVERIRR